MKEHSILFSGPMIPRLLDDSKTVTRRLSKQWLKVKAGDRLWVREAWQPLRTLTDAEREQQGAILQRFFDGAVPPEQMVETVLSLPMGTGETRCLYAADFGDWAYSPDSDLRPWKPSIHMPRRFSRITLEATEDAREEALRSITEEDAQAEGCTADDDFTSSMRYAILWDSLHPKPGERWCDNPTIVRLAFRRIA